jgi:hypothetical protein
LREQEEGAELPKLTKDADGKTSRRRTGPGVSEVTAQERPRLVHKMVAQPTAALVVRPQSPKVFSPPRSTEVDFSCDSVAYDNIEQMSDGDELGFVRGLILAAAFDATLALVIAGCWKLWPVLASQLSSLVGK